MPPERRSRTWAFSAAAYALWLVLALGWGARGLFALGPWLVGAVILLAVVGQLVAYVAVPPFRAGLRAIDLRWLVLMHAGRLFAVIYLVYYARGRLPGAFALSAGWGDVAVAGAAFVIAWRWKHPITRARRGVLTLWNAAGLIDILAVAALGLWYAVSAPESMTPVSVLPLAVVPLFFAPMYIASHLFIAARLYTDRPR